MERGIFLFVFLLEKMMLFKLDDELVVPYKLMFVPHNCFEFVLLKLKVH